uniref:phenylalanine-tRNA ligase beta subunit n=1 Tax=Hypnea cervicornis TaxID=387623 RepID=UPI0021B6A876|nr:phenylalanine-tRNA ligase beta subunit [Hypnea cervicornis]UVW80645.1 phenylalanine-tRNA ligase beta subunit [Hypnea cervicornis]
MKFSWKWIKEVSNLPNITLEESITKLTLAGFEIDAINNKKHINDTTLELSLTANRSDAASIIGIARELKTIFKSQNIPEVNKNIKIKKQNIQFNTIELTKSKFTDKNLSDIQITIIKNIQVQDSPEWLINKLEACDIVQDNTLSNISKYINIKWGQDIEIFDSNKIDHKEFREKSMAIRHINIKENKNPIIISDETSNKFFESLTYKNNLISLLGIKSNSNFHCDDNTSSVIIFGHICKPQYVKKTTKLLKYKTEKSQKHVKGLSRNDFINAYNETIILILKLAKYTQTISNYIWHKQNNPLTNILINTKNIDNILGNINQTRPLSTQEIINTLKQLNFQPKEHQNFIEVNIPEYRKYDIKRQIDITEEIGRIYGFNHFIDTLPRRPYKGYISRINVLIKKVRNILNQLGLYEIIHYSLVNTNNQESRPYISLHNPLQEDQRYLRKYLIYNLLNTLKYNNKQKNKFMECFEISKTFQVKRLIDNQKEIYYKENIHVAGIIGKDNFSRRLWSEKGQELSWFQAKGLLESLFEQIHAQIEWNNDFKITEYYKNIINICHPYKFAILRSKTNQRIIGIFGELNANYSKEINHNHKSYIFEINLKEILKTIQIKKHLSYIFTKYSLYPSVTRNVCLKLNKKITAKAVEKIILSHNKKLIESVEIIDEYNTKNHIDKSRNVSYKIIYRSLHKTLNDHDINEIDKKLSQTIKYIHQTISSSI